MAIKANARLKPVLIFDLDGTLADSALDILDSLRFLLARESCALPTSTNIRSLVGQGARILIERGFQESLPKGSPPLSLKKQEELLQQFLAHYEEHIADKTILFPDVVSTLKTLVELGWTLTVCTNKMHKLAFKLLQSLNISQYFPIICGQDTYAFSKPDPRVLWSILAEVTGDPQRAIMIGDSKTDIDTARAAGIPVIATDFGYSPEPISLLRPDRIISHFKELPQAIESLCSLRSCPI